VSKISQPVVPSVVYPAPPAAIRAAPTSADATLTTVPPAASSYGMPALSRDVVIVSASLVARSLNTGTICGWPAHITRPTSSSTDISEPNTIPMRWEIVSWRTRVVSWSIIVGPGASAGTGQGQIWRRMISW